MRSLVFIRVIDLGPLPVSFSDFLIGGFRWDVKQRVQFSVGRSFFLFHHLSTFSLLLALGFCREWQFFGFGWWLHRMTVAVTFRGLGVSTIDRHPATQWRWFFDFLDVHPISMGPVGMLKTHEKPIGLKPMGRPTLAKYEGPRLDEIGP